MISLHYMICMCVIHDCIHICNHDHVIPYTISKMLLSPSELFCTGIFVEVWLYQLLPSDLNPKNLKYNGMIATDNIYRK